MAFAVTPAETTLLSRPLSAVSALPISLDPSIAPTPIYANSGSADTLMRSMFACTEESGKSELYSQLRQQVLAEGGTLPPAKRRGVGAEVLGLLNALAATCSQEETSLAHSSGRGQSDAVVRSQSLVAWSMAVVDAMQRSSTKQLHGHLEAHGVDAPTVASFELRHYREKELLATCLQQMQQGTVSPSVLLDAILEVTGLVQTAEGVDSRAEKKQPGEIHAPRNVDLRHTLTLVIG